MNQQTRILSLLTAGGLLLAGCASSSDTGEGGITNPRTEMTPGMVMPNGSTMGAAQAGMASQPSAAAKMICSTETHEDITEILGIQEPPPSTSSWREHIYTCRYELPMGTLVVSVKQAGDPATAQSYFASLRHSLGRTESLDGLGEDSYGTKNGTVVLIKDNDTLTVDATRLPDVFGTQGSKRFDFAYELASDILGCWTGD